jgi:hypothetical protein
MLKDIDSGSNLGNPEEAIPPDEKTKPCEAITDPEKGYKAPDI